MKGSSAEGSPLSFRRDSITIGCINSLALPHLNQQVTEPNFYLCDTSQASRTASLKATSLPRT